MQATIGFIGLGKMGAGMARNLLAKGFPLLVHDVRREVVAALASAGARPAASVGKLAKSCSIVITMLPSPRELDEVALGPDGVRANLAEGSLFIDMGTVGPAVSQRIAEAMRAAKVDALDAPVSRGQEAANAGTLSIMVGGKREAFERAEPLLKAMGTDIFYCGKAGMGSATKLVNNLIQGTITAIVAEGLVLGVKAGVEVESLLQVLGASSADNFVLRKFFPQKALSGDLSPGGTVYTVQKDLELATALGRELQVPLLLGSLAHQLYGVLRGRGKGELDFTAILGMVEEAAGVEVRLARPSSGSNRS